jgi:hypothetical protein
VVERSVTTGNVPTAPRALKWRRTRVVTVENSGPASLPGREKSLLVCPGGYARATPPANIRRPSGARNSFAEFASSIRTRRIPYASALPASGKTQKIGVNRLFPAVGESKGSRLPAINIQESALKVIGQW